MQVEDRGRLSARGRARGRDGDLLTGAEFPLQGRERYVRVQVEDERGRYAWSNPLFVHAE